MCGLILKLWKIDALGYKRCGLCVTEYMGKRCAFCSRESWVVNVI